MCVNCSCPPFRYIIFKCGVIDFQIAAVIYASRFHSSSILFECGVPYDHADINFISISIIITYSTIACGTVFECTVCDVHVSQMKIHHCLMASGCSHVHKGTAVNDIGSVSVELHEDIASSILEANVFQGY